LKPPLSSVYEHSVDPLEVETDGVEARDTKEGIGRDEGHGVFSNAPPAHRISLLNPPVENAWMESENISRSCTSSLCMVEWPANFIKYSCCDQ